MGTEDKKIHGAIHSIIKNIGAVSKDNKNDFHGYKFRGIDQFMNALHPLLAQYGVVTLPECTDHQYETQRDSVGKIQSFARVMMKYTFHSCEDGSQVSCTVPGEGIDKGDKATNKAMAAAYKYAMMQTFCIPTEEIVDADKTSPEHSAPVAPSDDVRKKKGIAYIGSIFDKLVSAGISPKFTVPDWAHDFAFIEQIGKVAVAAEKEYLTKMSQ